MLNNQTIAVVVPAYNEEKQIGQVIETILDFLVEADTESTHVLNAVSPAYTEAFPFGEQVVKEYI